MLLQGQEIGPMKLTEIKYKNKTIKVEFKNIEDYAVYHTTDNQLVLQREFQVELYFTKFFISL